MRPWSHLKLYRALAHRPIRILWACEALSAVGDEVYKVALTWLAVGMIGANAGYLSAAQAGAILVFGLIGGYWADHWDPRRTMLHAERLVVKRDVKPSIIAEAPFPDRFAALGFSTPEGAAPTRG